MNVAPLKVTRPPVRWHGGKFRMASTIIKFFPRHRIYTEAFGGGAGVLLRKPRSYAEVYNDLDEDVVTLFRVLQDPAGEAELLRLLRATPFARREFEVGFDRSAAAPIERARRLVIRSFMGFGSNSHSMTNRGHQSTGFRADSNKSGTTPAHDWMNLPDTLPAVAARMRGVVIECRDARKVLERHDGKETLHYLDPPYVHETRSTFKSGKQAYHHEMTEDDHRSLLGTLKGLEGMVVLSGYPTELYDDELRGWARHEFGAYADGAKKRTEVLWLNRSCADMLAHEKEERGRLLFPIEENR